MKFHVTAVLILVCDDFAPDITSVENASYIFDCNLAKDIIGVYEFIVYPSVTENIGLLIFERKYGSK